MTIMGKWFPKVYCIRFVKVLHCKTVIFSRDLRYYYLFSLAAVAAVAPRTAPVAKPT